VRIAGLEALGWFTFSHQRDQIITACKHIIQADADKSVQTEALKTRNRILAGMTDPVNP